MRKPKTQKIDGVELPAAGEEPKADLKSGPRSAQRAQESARRMAAQRRKVFGSALLIAVLVTGLAGYVLYGRLVTDVEARRLVELTEHETRVRTQSVSAYLQKLQQQLLQETKRPEVIGALAAADSEALALLERSIGMNFYRSLKVRLIPLGTAAMERDSATPIRFAELDLIRRAERGLDAFPELVLIGDAWQLHLIEAIRNGEGSILGTLMVTLDPEEMQQSFRVGDANYGESVLLQKFPGSAPQTVIQMGQGGAGKSREYPIPDSYLSIRFTPSPYLLGIAKEFPTLWLLLTSLIAVVALIMAWLGARVLLSRQQPASSLSPKTTPVTKPKKTTEDKATEEESLVNPLYQNQDILDITVIEEDADILGLKSSRGKKTGAKGPQALDPESVPATIFRSYDIRGLVGNELTPELAEKIGQAVGSEALDQGDVSIVVARDGRLHSEELSERLIRGIVRSGCQVLDIGVVPTPLMYFATFHLPETSSGIMVTASHNPAEYNGFKMVINGTTLADDAVMNIRSRILRQDYHRGEGGVEYRQVINDYIDRIFSDVALATTVSLVIDAGNAVTGVVAPRLFEELGCNVIPLYCDLDGNFPNHDPDPCNEKNLQDLLAKVRETGADMGVAFDGDGDRLVVVTPAGKILWPDQLLMLFARDVLSRNPGADVIFDVKCSRQLNQVISSYGGRPIMWKTGHSHMKAKMIETGALIGGEYSGHIFIKDRWYGFDDGLYAMARLLEIITLRDQKIDDIFAAFPEQIATPEYKIPVAEEEKFALVEKLIAQGDFQNGKLTTIDGLRVDFSKGWGLVRASNTSPALTLRFEAESQEALEKIVLLFKRELSKLDSKLSINF